MKALRIIPFFVVALLLSYFGLLFVEGNPTRVTLNFGSTQSPEARLGFVVMTSVLIGMILGVTLAAAQMSVLLFQNRSLRKRLGGAASARHGITPTPQDKTPA